MTSDDARPLQDRPGEAPAGEAVVTCEDEAATCRAAEDLAMALRPGDCVCLVGDLGAGKSTFARALIRALADDDALDVPSPTFTLVQSYTLPRFAVAHFDLYRLEDPEEVDELGLEDALETGVALVEWPERAAAAIPRSRLVLRIDAEVQEGARRLAFSWEEGDWGHRIARTFAIRDLVVQAGMERATRRYFQGDASPRRFETVVDGERRAILVNADPALRPPAPVLRDGLSYAEIVHLADQSSEAVVAVAHALRERGFATPALLGADLQAGILLQEDLGRGKVVDTEGNPVPERYAAAMDVLADLHATPPENPLPLPEAARASPNAAWHLPSFDLRAFLVEVELFLDWSLPEAGITADDGLRAEFAALWTPLLESALAGSRTWVLRDYHSPNLIWRAERKGHERIGIVDTQDTVIGPDAYDVASLAQDARVDIPRQLEADLVARYVARRLEIDPAFDTERFARDYAIVAAQRATRILGVFRRLHRRDGKPAYLRHLPRVRDYLVRALKTGDLAELREWFAGHDPDLAEHLGRTAH
uniref:tRNA (adenosine(37)-N6)-threonylcarbamoyltransferase complex ATPase subunit type 1 TsaE n=1 Tax=Stappia sp. TaxID=1870903 RepID=UPI003BA96D16